MSKKSQKRNKYPKISIIIPSFNKVEFIGETLKSIVSQDYPNFEVIIQDGGSTDGTQNIIEKYAKKYPKTVKWVSKKDKGQVDAINKGIRKANAEILAYINADDIYNNGAFKKVGEAYLKNPNTLWFAGKGKVINKKGNEVSNWVTWYKNLLLKLNHYSLLLVVNYLFQPSVFLNRDAYKKYGPFKGTKNYVLEYDLWLRLGKENMPVVINNTLSFFRFSGDNISTNLSKQLMQDDYNIARQKTENFLIMLLHRLNNTFRLLIVKFPLK